MEIWVDADACPGVIREIIAKAAHKRAINTTFVANHSFSLPKSPHVRLYQVPSGFDEADKEIKQRASEGDLVITADIPLASDVLAVSDTRTITSSSGCKCATSWRPCAHRASIPAAHQL